MGVSAFPLGRADKVEQYILGLAFLQSAYLSADYERNTFTLSQAVYPSSSTKENIVPILRPGSNDKHLGAGAIVGIAVGGFMVLATSLLLAIILYRRKKARHAKPPELDDTEVQNLVTHELPSSDVCRRNRRRVTARAGQ